MTQPTAAPPAVLGASWSRSAASCSVLPTAPNPWLTSVCITAPRGPARRWAAPSPTAPGGQRSPGCASLHLWAGSPAGPDAKDRGHSAASSSWWACSDTRVVVDGGGGRWPYPLACARQRFTFCLATRSSSLSLTVGVRVASTWVDPPRRWREGQGHDGWNREMVQRRQGLRLHRP